MKSESIYNLVARSPLRKGFLDLLTAGFAIQFLGFGTLLLVPRFVSPDELGQLKVIQSFVSLFAIFAGFGFNTAVLKLCSEDRSAENRHSILNEALRSTIWTSAVAFAAVLLFARSGVFESGQHIRTWIVVYAAVLPFDALTNVLASYLQARSEIKLLARSQLIAKAQAVLIVVLATWAFGFRGFIFGTIVGYVVGLAPFIRYIGLGILGAPRIKLPSLFWSMSGYSSLANAVNTLGRHGDIFILGLFYQNPRDLGYYALAKIFLSGANIVTSTAQRITLPRLSEQSQDEKPFRLLVRTSQFHTILLALFVAVGIHIVATLIVTYVYDPEYLAAIKYLDILLVKYVLWSSFAIFGVALIGMGKPAYNFVGACVTTPVALGLTYYFLSTEGTIGVAWAQVGAAAASLVVLSVLYRIARSKHFQTTRP